MSEPFDAKRSRAKRPCPVWVDAFLRDTQELEADEIGAYFLILMAMWVRPSCDFPDDERKLARVCRVSARLWRSRIGPTILPFFIVEDGVVSSKRLRQEAAFVEEFVTKQHRRASSAEDGENAEKSTYAKPQGTHKRDGVKAENSDKPLKNNEVGAAAAKPRPSRGRCQPNNPTTQHKGGGKPPPTRARDPAGFVQFWDEAYPHDGSKKNRKGCAKLFAAAVKRGVPPVEIIAGAFRYRDDPKVRRGYILNPETWLRNERWTDEAAPPPGGPNGRQSPLDERRAADARSTDYFVEAGRRSDAPSGDPPGGVDPSERGMAGRQDQDASLAFLPARHGPPRREEDRGGLDLYPQEVPAVRVGGGRF